MTRGPDWTDLLRAGLGLLRLSPAVFWELTPFELGLMLAPVGPAPLALAELRAMMARHPDQTEESGDGA